VPSSFACSQLSITAYYSPQHHHALLVLASCILQTSEVPLRKALAEWIRSMTNTHASIATFLRKASGI
jgi:hypothetical protein